jgi:hypothetical protein
VDAAVLGHPRGEVGALSFELTDYGWFDMNRLPPMIDFHRFAVEYYVTHHLNERHTGKTEHGN